MCWIGLSVTFGLGSATGALCDADQKDRGQCQHIHLAGLVGELRHEQDARCKASGKAKGLRVEVFQHRWRIELDFQAVLLIECHLILVRRRAMSIQRLSPRKREEKIIHIDVIALKAGKSLGKYSIRVS
jgi:hypothetical protein